MEQSLKQRKKHKDDCILGKQHIHTGGDNDMGKMVEYAAMRDAGFTPDGKAFVAPGFSNAFMSGKSTFDANPAKQGEANKLAKKLKAKFSRNKAANKAKGLKCP